MLFLATLAAATLAQAAPTEWTHTVPVAHADTNATATYVARPNITTRQIGMATGTRPSTVRCIWTADISVERRLGTPAGDTSGVREIASTKTFSGSRHGSCMNNRRAINQEIAAKAPEVNAHLLAVADRDQRELRSEIETLAPPTGR
ncbi:MAG: hypothetical protein ACOYLS_06320 [Polymorphobacter sp.]